MAEITSNDQAFLRISEELRRTENSLKVLTGLKSIVNDRDMQYSLQRLGSELKDGDIHTPEIQGAIGLLKQMTKGSDSFASYCAKIQQRCDRLKALSDAYLRGEDIIQARLAMD